MYCYLCGRKLNEDNYCEKCKRFVSINKLDGMPSFDFEYEFDDEYARKMRESYQKSKQTQKHDSAYLSK